MKKDPTEFRQRFALWKNGEKPYENGLPKYLDGKDLQWDTFNYKIPYIPEKSIKLTNAGLATGARISTNMLDSLANTAEEIGLPIQTAIGLATKESTLGNPTDDRSMRTLLSAKHREDLEHELWKRGIRGNDQYGQHLVPDDAKTFYWDQLSLINYYNGERHLSDAFARKENVNSLPSTLKKGLLFYKDHPDRYNPGQKNYQRLVDKRGAEVMLSPEVLKWLKERNIKKATGRFNRLNPLLNESKLNPTKYKDGKLPEYEDGKNDGLGSGVYIGAIPFVLYTNNKQTEQNKIVDQKIANKNNYGWDDNIRSYFLNSPQWLKNNINPAWNIIDVNALKVPFGMQDMSNATKDDNAFFQRHLGYTRDKKSMPITGIRFAGDYNEDGTLRLPLAEYTGLSKQAKDFIRKGILEGKIEPNEDGSWTEIKERRKRWGKYTSHLGTYSIRENNNSGIYDVVDTYDFPWYNPILNRQEGKQIEIRDSIHGPNAKPMYYNINFSKKKNTQNELRNK